MVICLRQIPLVLDLLRAVHEATKAKTPPYWVSVESLDLESDPERVDAAVALAVLNGWLQVGGTPGHSVAITSSGIAQINED